MVSLQKHLERVRGRILIANIPETDGLTDGIINDLDFTYLDPTITGGATGVIVSYHPS